MSADKIERQIIVPKGSAPPLGPYSPAVKLGNLLFVSGQLGMDAGALVQGGVVPETEQVV